MSERAPIGSTRTVLWLGILSLGIWLFFEGLEARSEQLETRRIVRDFKERKDVLENDRDKVRGTITLIKGNDPAAVKGALQKEGYIEEGRVAIDEPPRTARKR